MPHVARIDEYGYLIVVDTWNHRLTRFDPDGRFAGWLGSKSVGATTAGWQMTGAAVASSGLGGFNAPVAFDFDSAGNLIVAEYGNHRLQRFASDGRNLGWMGGGQRSETSGAWGFQGTSRAGNEPGAFRHPYDVVSHCDTLYVADTENGRIQVIRPRIPTGSI